MRKDYLFRVFACAALATSMVVTGVGCSQSTNNNTEVSSEVEDGSVTGMVQSVSDTEITVAVMGNAPGGQKDGKASDSANGESSDSSTDGQSSATTSDDKKSGDTNGQPPERPDGDSSSDTNGQPPERPDGDSSSDTNGQPPERPNGDNSSDSNGQPPERPNGDSSSDNHGPGNMETKTYTINDSTEIKDAEGNTISASDLSEGQMVEITCDSDNIALTITVSSHQGPGGNGGNGGNGAPGGNASQPTSYDAVNSFTEDKTLDGKTVSSTGTDESAVYVSNGANVTLSNTTVKRTSSDSTGGDSASFYGVGAALLTTDGTLTVSDCNIETDSAGGAGVFAYGDGVAKVSNTTITTKQDTSGGIHVAGGGTLEATNLTVETSGGSAAAIRSDRGGGTMTVKGGSYTTNGSGSPAVYCTANITVDDATLTANGSEAVCIEGLNSLSLTDCNVTSNMPENEQNDCTWSVILYQSMSGDSEVGNSQFTMKGGSLVSNNGGLFYTTNTESTFTIEDVDITTSGDNDFFLKCTGNSNARGWGETGKNGAQCTFTAIKQKMTGDIIWDSISELTLNVTEKSVLNGAIVQDESNAGDGGDGFANITIDSSSKWIVTGDSTVTKLVNKGTILDSDGKTVTIKGKDGNVLSKGTGKYTITVTSYEK